MTQNSDQLIRFVDGWKTTSIIVVGDFMLDRYTYGNADRLSPDAPVPVLAVRRESYMPGGAANVCLDLRALRCDVSCVGVVGKDDMADHLRTALKERGCKVTGLVASNDRPTTVKHNFVGLAQHRHPQKMFRVDHERKAPIADSVAERILKHVKQGLAKADALCIEDYNKGVLSAHLCAELIKLATKHDVPVFVDPAAITDYTKYRGATCITPNRTEAALATGMDEQADDAPLAMARKLMRDLKLDTVVLTLDKQGALLAEKGKAPQTVPTRARQVYDVTGAGDMVLAMLASARANGADWRTAVALANTAAGLEVEKFGVVPIELDEVLLSLLRDHHETAGKVRQLEQLLPELMAYRRQGRTIAFTNGCFDILHAGHVSYLRQASKVADLLVVGLNSDDSIRRIKGDDRPVNREDDRILVMSELESVSYVIVFEEDTPTKLIKAIKPDVLVKGGDYKHDEVVGHEIVEAYGGRVELVPVVRGRSTTNIIRKVQRK